MTTALRRTRAATRRHPLAAFVLLAYALSWWPWILRALGHPVMPVLAFGPFAAALVVLSLTTGSTGVKALLRAMGTWRVGTRWWAAAILIPVVLTAAATALNVAFGAPAPSSDDLRGWTGVLPTAAAILLVPGLGGAWEEPGWRGYALPTLLRERGPLAASLIVGAVWSSWHIPLFLSHQIHWSDIGGMLGASVVFTWLLRRALGSVLIAMVCHAMNNAVSGEFFSPMFSGPDAVRQGWMLAVAWCVAAAGVVVGSPEFRPARPGRLRLPVACPRPDRARRSLTVIS